MYEQEVARVKRDLGIENAVVQLTFTPERFAGKRNRWGWHQPQKDGSHKVVVAYGGKNGKRRSYRNVVRTIAHELRHVWQYETKAQVDTKSGKSWVRTWTGSPLSPGSKTWVKMPYRQQPHEIDAFAYMDLAWVKLFDGLPKLNNSKVPPKPAAAPVQELAYLFLEAQA
jgi:hypothetical protein